MGFTPFRDDDLDYDLDATFDPRFPAPFRVATRYAFPDLSPLYFDGNAGFPVPQLGGFWDVVAKVASPVGAVVGGIVGGPAGAAAGAAAGAGVAAVIKGKAKEAIKAAEEATGVDIPPAGEALAEAIIGNGGSVEDAKAEVVKRVVSANIDARARQTSSFAGDNSGIRALLVSKKTGQAFAPAVSAYAGGDGYSTRMYAAGGTLAPASSVAVQPSAPTPIYKNPWVIGGAVAALGAAYFVMQKRGHR